MSWLYPRQCTTTYPTPAAATRRGMSGSGTWWCTGPQRELGYPRPHGVDGDGQPGPDELGDHRPDPAQLLGLVDALRPGPGGLTAHVHDVRALRGQVQAVRDGRVRPVPQAAVGERVGRDVHHAHQQAVVLGGQLRHGRSLRRILPRPSLCAIRRSSSRGQTRNASASSAASAILGASLVLGKTKKRGCQTGQNLALNLYSDSIWNHLDMKMSTDRQARSTGPAPIRSPRSSAARNTAKFSEMRLMPSAGAAVMPSMIRKSSTPGWPALYRRIRSRDRPSGPHGTS